MVGGREAAAVVVVVVVADIADIAVPFSNIIVAVLYHYFKKHLSPGKQGSQCGISGFNVTLGIVMVVVAPML